jgi:hypothetical protein
VSAPIWSEKESDARAVVQNGTMGDLSVTWCKDLGLWLMTYDSREPAPRGILFSYSQTPWGPWSDPQIIFNAARDGALGKSSTIRRQIQTMGFQDPPSERDRRSRRQCMVAPMRHMS